MNDFKILRAIVWLFPIFLVFNGFAQKDPSKVKTQNITINSSEGKKQFRTTNDLTPNVRPKVSRWYYWYHPHELHVTAGNFSGRLLDGDYDSFYPDGSLKEKGEFKKGLKHGEWMMWYENGQLKEVAEFRKGEKHGDYTSYDPKGNVMIQGVFKRGTYAGLKKSAWKQFVDFITFKKMRNPQDAL
ncbi:MAG: hypothetical protein GC178_01785 [Flavobacteriales bacterium]|nr:hypothetical protein [Flavobacteriales bacterium]